MSKVCSIGALGEERNTDPDGLEEKSADGKVQGVTSVAPDTVQRDPTSQLVHFSHIEAVTGIAPLHATCPSHLALLRCKKHMSGFFL